MQGVMRQRWFRIVLALAMVALLGWVSLTPIARAQAANPFGGACPMPTPPVSSKEACPMPTPPVR